MHPNDDHVSYGGCWLKSKRPGFKDHGNDMRHILGRLVESLFSSKAFGFLWLAAVAGIG